ncbi:MAG: hypothetical protein HF978_16505 [Desulfobacteraceae bacterium]|nr:hypothetical protein [Desulfobacteraceae bacterium]MBC2757145.1 hypothetical protein [Desulfobacteraceae bacterium]
MDPISRKVKQWIDEGKDPRSAHWQGGLEAMLNVFMPYLEPGRLIPVQPLEEEELFVFQAVMEIIDLSPNLPAAFLPPSIAEKVIPPESAEELQHIEKGQPSFKILIARPGKEQRILCAEISEHAKKPGVDIFQSGALLGTYNFQNQQDCFTELNKIIRVHIWEKEKWSQDDYKRYTINWFEKVIDLHKGTVSVEKDFSFFHSPTLIKSNKIDVIFILMSEIMLKRLHNSGDPLKEAVSAIRAIDDTDVKKAQLNDLADKVVFELLTVMKDCNVVKFDDFTDKESKQFNRESATMIQKIVKYMGKVEGRR